MHTFSSLLMPYELAILLIYIADLIMRQNGRIRNNYGQNREGSDFYTVVNLSIWRIVAEMGNHRHCPFALSRSSKFNKNRIRKQQTDLENG